MKSTPHECPEYERFSLRNGQLNELDNSASLRTAVVVSQLGYGGAERQTVELLRQLRGTPWAPAQVVCLSAETVPYGRIVQDLGYPLRVIPRVRGFEIRRCRDLKRILRTNRIQVVHAVNWLAGAYCLLALPRDCRVVCSVRNSHLPSGLVRRVLLRCLLRRSGAVIVNSLRGREFVLRECGVREDRLFVVENGIDIDRIQPGARAGTIRRELAIQDGAPIVTYIGRKAPVKNIPLLLAVTRRLLSALPALHVVIVGHGLDRSILHGTQLEPGGRVHCLGTRDDVPSVLRDSSLLILTSDSEGTPNAVLEALVAGVPVVATPVGDVPRMVLDGCGLLVAADAELLSDAALRILADVSSYARAVRASAPILEERYSVAKMATRTREIWEATRNATRARQ